MTTNRNKAVGMAKRNTKNTGHDLYRVFEYLPYQLVSRILSHQLGTPKRNSKNLNAALIQKAFWKKITKHLIIATVYSISMSQIKLLVPLTTCFEADLTQILEVWMYRTCKYLLFLLFHRSLKRQAIWVADRLCCRWLNDGVPWQAQKPATENSAIFTPGGELTKPMGVYTFLNPPVGSKKFGPQKNPRKKINPFFLVPEIWHPEWSGLGWNEKPSP